MFNGNIQTNPRGPIKANLHRRRGVTITENHRSHKIIISNYGKMQKEKREKCFVG